MRRLLFLLAFTAPLSAQDGGQLYTLYCSACHAPDGKGATGGSSRRSPAARGSLAIPTARSRSSSTACTGRSRSSGKTYNLEMPPQGAVLPDDQIAAILTHVRSSWGNQAAAVTPEAVKTIRAATAGRKTPWTAAEILKLHPLPLEKTALPTSFPKSIAANGATSRTSSTLKPDSVEEEHDGIISLADCPHANDFAMVWEGQLDAPPPANTSSPSTPTTPRKSSSTAKTSSRSTASARWTAPASSGPESRSPRASTPSASNTSKTRATGYLHRLDGLRDKQFRWLTASKDTSPKAREPFPIGPVDGRARHLSEFHRRHHAPRHRRRLPRRAQPRLQSADHLAPELLWTGAFLDGAAKWRRPRHRQQSARRARMSSSSPANPAHSPPGPDSKATNSTPPAIPLSSVQIGEQVLLDSWRMTDAPDVTSSTRQPAFLREITLTGNGPWQSGTSPSPTSSR